jgi:hypothetical protein
MNYLTVNGQCIEKSCDASDISAAAAYGIYICNLYGVAVTSYYSLNLPATSTSAAANTATGITSVTALTTTTIANSPATAAVNTQSGVSPTATLTFTPPAQEEKSHIGAIVGGITGGMAVLGLIIGAVYFLFIRRRNQGQQQSYVTGPFVQPQYGEVSNANHDFEKHDRIVQSAPVLAQPNYVQPSEPRTTAPSDPIILGGRLRYPDTDAVGEPQDTQNVGNLPSGRLQYRNVE